MVVKGFLQGNIEQTYSPVVDFSKVPAALAVAVQKNLRVHQRDVRTAFLHGKIDSDVYIRPPRGDGIKLCSNQSLKLNKGLYGPKQASGLWFEKWESVVCSLGLKKLSGDQCFYRRSDIWVLLYVDDVLLMGLSLDDINAVKTNLSKTLDIKDLGELRDFLGVSFYRDASSAWLSQKAYVNKVLHRFGMENCKAVTTPACTRRFN